MDEFELIRRFFDRPATVDGVVVGVGDDGAVLDITPGTQQVSVIDTLVEGVHYPKGFAPADTGYRVVAVNLSDMAAMGAVPRYMTLALSIPRADEEWLAGFAEGLYHAAEEAGVALVGGDTTRAPQVVATVQMAGEVEPGRALLRQGARPGDTIYVTGTLGDAAAGLHGLVRGQPVKELLNRFARPSARVAYGQALVGSATAAIDVSDGLHDDLGKLLGASGVGAEVDLDRLPISEALAANFGEERRHRFALAGGDDYELCFTASREPPDGGILPVTAIGTVTDDHRLVCRLDGKTVSFADSGYRHFQ